jgi:hypothetical protein
MASALDPHHHLFGYERVESFLYKISGTSPDLDGPAFTVFRVYECRIEKLN